MTVICSESKITAVLSGKKAPEMIFMDAKLQTADRRVCSLSAVMTLGPSDCFSRYLGFMEKYSAVLVSKAKEVK